MSKEALYKAIWKTFKEALRWFVCAIIPVLVTYFGDLPYEWAGYTTIGLRLLDKIIHELGKETKDEGLTLGLTRF